MLINERFLTRNSSAIFLKGKDLISLDPLLFGIHEPVITNLIYEFSKSGYNDFLLDIGSNIGITTFKLINFKHHK